MSGSDLDASDLVPDRMIDHGRLRGRIIAGAVAYFVATLGLAGGLLAPSLIFAAPFFNKCAP